MAVENLPMEQMTPYGVQIVHSHTEGIVASPIAGPPPSNCSLVRLHAPFEMISVVRTAVSAGKPPNTLASCPQRSSVLSGRRRAGSIRSSAPEGLGSAFAMMRCRFYPPWTLGGRIPHKGKVCQHQK